MSTKKILGINKAFWVELRILITLIIIALLVKATVVEIYVVPTGSMENTILPGDMLIGNKFIYGLRTPKKISLIWTRLGFDVPSVRLPKFKEVESGDVVIFEFPRDPFQKYVKRCIGTAGQEIQIDQGQIYIDGEQMDFPDEGKYSKGYIFPSDRIQETIYSYFSGNQDNIESFVVPYKGMQIDFDQIEDWTSILTLLIQDGNKIELGEQTFTLIDPFELSRMVGFLKYKFLDLVNPGSKEKNRKKQIIEQTKFKIEMRDKHHQEGIFNPWEINFNKFDYQLVYDHLLINDVPVSELKTYTFKHDYYFFMGDNRDNSSDSRFWGFVPDHQILGTPLFSLVNLMEFGLRLKFIN